MKQEQAEAKSKTKAKAKDQVQRMYGQLSLQEPGRITTVDGDYDVVVCGGGPAGFAAAVAAGRLGARVLLVEKAGALGGVWTSGLLSFIMDNGGKGGLLAELQERLQFLDGYRLQPHPASDSEYDGSRDFTYDAEVMKLVLEAMCVEAGVELLLHTQLCGVLREGSHVTAVLTEGPGGRRAVTGRVFIDCTGNGDVGAYAGCSHERGHPVTGKTQPATLYALVSGGPKLPLSWFRSEEKQAFYDLLRSVGREPSYRLPSLFALPHPDLVCLMINHEYGVQCDSARQITDATVHARRELFEAVAALRTHEEWQNARIVATASHIGLREGRRLEGHYQLTVDDVVQGAQFPDGLFTVTLPVDIHDVTAHEGEGAGRDGLVAQPYQIPYRALIATAVDNLAMAGRCISGDFYAHASYRVTGNSVAMGEATDIASAWAALQGLPLVELSGTAVAAEMRQRGYTGA
ncbi:FAD-dependent oxidoreductase [Paenibacillus daejeonensis]|uniref:FAD-dependent oxidoreductase n=1 Tax=Paenibacillus daejeonensis TaxID=135193 RepID=UPI0003744F9E|nr:FAD-dependent oxidoreductase [Paenibacillus daejeonensis]